MDEQADVEDDLKAVADIPEARRKGHREQKRKQELRARQRHPQLVEELEELPVGALLGRLLDLGVAASRR